MRKGFVAPLILVLAVTLGGCGLTRDDAGARDEVVALPKAGRLQPSDGFAGAASALPNEYASLSDGGEVLVTDRSEGSFTLIFFKFRGLNHYTGWVYSESDLVEDPLGHQPFVAQPIGGNWYEVIAG
jgi:hypothetical protein